MKYDFTNFFLLEFTYSIHKHFPVWILNLISQLIQQTSIIRYLIKIKVVKVHLKYHLM